LFFAQCVAVQGLDRDKEFAAFGAAAVEDFSSIGGAHAFTKSVFTAAAYFTALISAFHNKILVLLIFSQSIPNWAVYCKCRKASKSTCANVAFLFIMTADFKTKSEIGQMKIRASIKADPTKGDKLVRRRGRLYVINKKDPNRKQRQPGLALKKPRKSGLLTTGK